MIVPTIQKAASNAVSKAASHFVSAVRSAKTSVASKTNPTTTTTSRAATSTTTTTAASTTTQPKKSTFADLSGIAVSAVKVGAAYELTKTSAFSNLSASPVKAFKNPTQVDGDLGAASVQDVASMKDNAQAFINHARVMNEQNKARINQRLIDPTLMTFESRQWFDRAVEASANADASLDEAQRLLDRSDNVLVRLFGKSDEHVQDSYDNAILGLKSASLSQRYLNYTYGIYGE